MSSRSSSPSCFLVGADSLLMECGEILLQTGWSVVGVAAGSTKVADWARRKGLRVVDVDLAAPRFQTPRQRLRGGLDGCA